MYTEYCNYTKYIDNYGDEISKIFKLIEKGIDGIAMPIYLLREVKSLMPEGMVLSCPIDFPSGYSSSKTREHMAIEALRSGANALDYVPNQYFLRNKFNYLSKEIKTMMRICKDYNASLRIFLDKDRVFNVVNLARLYASMKVDFGFITLGYHREDFQDNLIYAALVEQKTKMNVIFNAHIWKEDQLEFIKKSKIFGVRLYTDNIWCKSSLKE